MPALKRREPGPMDRVSNTKYLLEASPKSGGGEGEIWPSSTFRDTY